METTQTNEEAKKRAGGAWWVLVIVVLIVLVLAVGWRMGWGPFSGASASHYQAVFLSNNQVYFGKLSKQNSNYPVLTEIYYLQVAQPLQPSQPASNVNLVKLGDELHGPADKMSINREHIIFVEDLKADSQVVKAIEQYKKNQATAAKPATP